MSVQESHVAIEMNPTASTLASPKDVFRARREKKEAARAARAGLVFGAPSSSVEREPVNARSTQLDEVEPSGMRIVV